MTGDESRLPTTRRIIVTIDPFPLPQPTSCLRDFLKGSYEHRNIRFGVREHAMSAICNGIQAYGWCVTQNAGLLSSHRDSYYYLKIFILSYYYLARGTVAIHSAQ